MPTPTVPEYHNVYVVGGPTLRSPDRESTYACQIWTPEGKKKNCYVGTFATSEEAALAFNIAAPHVVPVTQAWERNDVPKLPTVQRNNVIRTVMTNLKKAGLIKDGMTVTKMKIIAGI